MENKVYYGEYSLQHWIDLILNKNIILPPYQRHFIWSENKVRILIDTFKKKQFVPPVTIGASKNQEKIENLILDGQQRLTSILLSYLGLFPDETYRKSVDQCADENDSPIDDDETGLDNVLEWTFRYLVEKGNNKEKIQKEIKNGHYKKIEIDITNEFLKDTFLGFAYLVPVTTTEKEQQKYFSSVFRNINIQGESLLPQESRKSLYYLDKEISIFLEPNFGMEIKVKNNGRDTKIDFVRYLSLLSEFFKNKSSEHIARGYKQKMEKYYEEYIYSIVGEIHSILFPDFSLIFPKKEEITQYLDRLDNAISLLELSKTFTSIIDMDICFFGLIYTIIFSKKTVELAQKEKIRNGLTEGIKQCKDDPSHIRTPGALKYLRSRIKMSIAIYEQGI